MLAEAVSVALLAPVFHFLVFAQASTPTDFASVLPRAMLTEAVASTFLACILQSSVGTNF